jgi:hypothetical protein
MPDWVKKKDTEFAAQQATLKNALVADEAAYGITADQSAAVEAALTTFNTKLAAADAAKGALSVAVAEKDAARAAYEALVRPMMRLIQETPTVTNEARTNAGLPIRDVVRTSSAPIAPRELVATLPSPTSAGLAWNSNGNASGVQYVVEKRVNNVGDWSTVDVVSATRLVVSGLAAGIRVDFRVRARRKSMLSDPSNTAAVYAD